MIAGGLVQYDSEREPAIGMAELSQIARGYLACDALVKKAPVRLLLAEAVSAGKFLILFCGDEDSVAESMGAAREVAGKYLIDELYIPRLHPRVIPAIEGKPTGIALNALGIVESFTVASAITCADLAAKETEVELVECRLAKGIGGKAYFILTGALYEVQASLQRCKDYLTQQGVLAGIACIPAPHDDIIALIERRT